MHASAIVQLAGRAPHHAGLAAGQGQVPSGTRYRHEGQGKDEEEKAETHHWNQPEEQPALNVKHETSLALRLDPPTAHQDDVDAHNRWRACKISSIRGIMGEAEICKRQRTRGGLSCP